MDLIELIDSLKDIWPHLNVNVLFTSSLWMCPSLFHRDRSLRSGLHRRPQRPDWPASEQWLHLQRKPQRAPAAHLPVQWCTKRKLRHMRRWVNDNKVFKSIKSLHRSQIINIIILDRIYLRCLATLFSWLGNILDTPTYLEEVWYPIEI